MNKFLM